jgi:gliding motility-associated-like protein
MCSKIAFVVLFLILGTHVSNAQNNQWSDSCVNYTYKAKIAQPFFMQNTLRATLHMDNNDVVIVANVQIKSPNIANVYENRILLQRVNYKGDSIWSRFIGFPNNIVDSTSFAYTAKQLRNGDILVVFSSTVYDNYGPILVRIDMNTGNVVWVKQQNFLPGGAGGGYIINSILEDSNGDIALAGDFFLLGLLMKVNGQNGNLIFVKKFIQRGYTSFSKILEADEKYYTLGGSSTSSFSLNILSSFDKTTGEHIKSFGIDSTSNGYLYFDNFTYENGVFSLAGNGFNYFNSATTLHSYVQIDTLGNIISSKIMKTNVPNNGFYGINWSFNTFDFKNRVGVSSIMLNQDEDLHIFKLNDDMTATTFSHIIPNPGSDFLADVAVAQDSGIIAAVYSSDTLMGYTPLLIKTLPTGKMGSCVTTDFPVYLIDTTTQLLKAVMIEDTFFILSTVQPNIQTYAASGYSWDVFCKAAVVSKIGKIQGATKACVNDNVTFTISKNIATPILFSILGNGAIEVNKTDSTIKIHFQKVGEYKVVALLTTPCATLTDTITITVTEALKPIIGPSTQQICNGDSITLNTTPNNYATYMWSNNSTLPTIVVSDTGLFFVKIKDVNGCTAADSIHINTFLNKPSRFLPNDTTICKYLPIYIKPTSVFSQYSWNNGSTQVPLKINRAGNYILQVTNNNGCIGKDTIVIAENGCKQWVRFPTAITPNNDGVNDVWKAYTYGSVKLFEVQIYNRWGQSIYKSNNYKDYWIGTQKGVQVPSGTYIIMARYKLEDEPLQLYKGIIQVIR